MIYSFNVTEPYHHNGSEPKSFGTETMLYDAYVKEISQTPVLLIYRNICSEPIIMLFDLPNAGATLRNMFLPPPWVVIEVCFNE